MEPYTFCPRLLIKHISQRRMSACGSADLSSFKSNLGGEGEKHPENTYIGLLGVGGGGGMGQKLIQNPPIFYMTTILEEELGKYSP